MAGANPIRPQRHVSESGQLSGLGSAFVIRLRLLFQCCTFASWVLTMPSLLLVVFALQLVIHLVNTVGAPVIDDLVSP